MAGRRSASLYVITACVWMGIITGFACGACVQAHTNAPQTYGITVCVCVCACVCVCVCVRFYVILGARIGPALHFASVSGAINSCTFCLRHIAN